MAPYDTPLTFKSWQSPSTGFVFKHSPTACGLEYHLEVLGLPLGGGEGGEGGGAGGEGVSEKEGGGGERRWSWVEVKEVAGGGEGRGRWRRRWGWGWGGGGEGATQVAKTVVHVLGRSEFPQPYLALNALA